jgi:hypothetical protein
MHAKAAVRDVNVTQVARAADDPAESSSAGYTQAISSEVHALRFAVRARQREIAVGREVAKKVLLTCNRLFSRALKKMTAPCSVKSLCETFSSVMDELLIKTSARATKPWSPRPVDWRSRTCKRRATGSKRTAS